MKLKPGKCLFAGMAVFFLLLSGGGCGSSAPPLSQGSLSAAAEAGGAESRNRMESSDNSENIPGSGAGLKDPAETAADSRGPEPAGEDSQSPDIAGGDIPEGDSRNPEIAEGDTPGGDFKSSDIAGGDIPEGDSRNPEIAEGDIPEGDSLGPEPAGGDNPEGDSRNPEPAGEDSQRSEIAGGDTQEGDSQSSEPAGGDNPEGDSRNPEIAEGDIPEGDSLGPEPAEGDTPEGDSRIPDIAEGDTPDDPAALFRIDWEGILEKYRNADEVSQLVFVRFQGGASARLQYYTKESGSWSLSFETDAFVGKNGIGKTREGDGKTPVGDFGVREAFGILPDPGTALPYVAVTDTTFACDEEGPYYNQIIDAEAAGHDCRGEHMAAIAPEYSYGIAIDYNPENIYPRGSAIFLHCTGEKSWTGGCVAISEEAMRKILETAGPGLRIVIGE